MNMKYYIGTMKHHPAEPDYYIDIGTCSDKEIDKLVEAKRNDFRDEWFRYIDNFYK